MKSMKKLFALVMAVAMVASMAVTSGATGGTISVTKPAASAAITYNIYKVFEAEAVPNNPGIYRYKLNSEWSSFASVASAYFTLDASGYVIWEKSSFNVAEGAALATLAKNKLPADAAVVGTVTGGNAGEEVSQTITENGYYLLVPQGTHSTTPSGFVLLVNDNTPTISQKDAITGLPNVTKQVQEDNGSVWGESNTADMGQIISFKTTIKAAAGATGYILHDKMDAGLTFDSVTSITIDGYAVTEGPNYTVNKSTGDNCAFHIEFNDSALTSLENNDEIVVEYTAHLNKSTEPGTAETNETWLIHTGSAETNHDTTTSTTFKIDFTKKFTDNGTELATVPGATFVLKNADDYFYKHADGVVTWVADQNQATTVATEDGKATLSFPGIDAGTYTIVETKVPGGFTPPATIPTVTITDANSTGTEITNTMGVTLPDTGGMGTTLFYALGGTLTLGALVLLITKKRVG